MMCIPLADYERQIMRRFTRHQTKDSESRYDADMMLMSAGMSGGIHLYEINKMN